MVKTFSRGIVAMETESMQSRIDIFRRSFEGSIKADHNKELQEAFTALDLDRVVAGVRSLFMQQGGWNECFLALAFGEPGSLDRAIPDVVPEHIREAELRRWNRYYSGKIPMTTVLADDVLVDSWDTSNRVSYLLGISVGQVDLIVCYFDSDRKGFTGELLRWLQARNVNAATVMAEAAREARAWRLQFEQIQEAEGASGGDHPCR
jgi:hypothetical protein